jgi:hypothetical protein
MSSLRLSHALHPSAMQETGQLLVNVLESALRTATGLMQGDITEGRNRKTASRAVFSKM